MRRGFVPEEVAHPSYREIQAYAFDPSYAWQLDTAVLNQTRLRVKWEPLQPGPVGEYLEVMDYDPASEHFYEPVDLDHPYLLAGGGYDPTEGKPQFHQQMVYAVAMTTIAHFERALGRMALWSPRREGRKRPQFVQRLRAYPHALREANAYYSPQKKALLFGYFPASADDPGKNLPGGMVFTCLSQDIIAHETTHALLDGVCTHLIEPTNPDTRAFHEAFADIVALFQHFTYPEAVRHQIALTRGDLTRQNMLGELAQQFGQGIGNRGALRNFIGEKDKKTGEWKPREPKRGEYERTEEPHARGAILVAAIFDAFLAIYKARISDLLRIATSGTGILPQGELHPDLVNRLAMEANTTAQHVLSMCIRALDYCPPVDLTFGEFLRGLITADADRVPEDARGYRIAFVEAFRRREIYPPGVRTLSPGSLVWEKPAYNAKLLKIGLPGRLRDIVQAWSDDGEAPGRGRGGRRQLSRRAKAFSTNWHECRELVSFLRSKTQDRDVAWQLGLDQTNQARPLDVGSARPARRILADGTVRTDLVIEVTQQMDIPRDPNDRRAGTMPSAVGATCWWMRIRESSATALPNGSAARGARCGSASTSWTPRT